MDDPQIAIAVGDEVVAEDGVVGSVEAVLRSETHVPRFVVVSVGRWIGRRHPVVPAELVSEVDRREGRIRLKASRARITNLPEAVPLLL